MNVATQEAAMIDESCQVLFEVLHQSVDAVVVTDDKHRIVLFNPAAEGLWQCLRAEVMGLPLQTLLPCPAVHVQPLVGDEQCQCLLRMQGSNRAVIIQRPDGSTQHASMSMSQAVVDGVTLYTACFRDTGEQQVRHDHLQQLALVVDNSDNAIFVSDAQRRVVYVNRGFTRLFGYGLEDFHGRTPSDVLSGPHTDPQLSQRIALRMAAGESLLEELLLYAHDGRPHWMSTAINPVHDQDGTLKGLVTVLTDITLTKMHQVLHQKALDAMVRDWTMVEVMTLICREVEHIAPELVMLISLVDNDGTLRTLAAPSIPASITMTMDGVAIGPRSGPGGTAAWRGRPLLITDIAQDPHCEQQRHLLLSLGLVACWSNPIKSSDGRVLGTISFYYRESRGPDELHARLADICQHLCALALERKQNSERVHQLAFYDTLTGLPNRIMFSAKAEQALTNIDQNVETAAVLLIDLDRFKRVNDAQGHSAGDSLLRDIAARLGHELPGANIIGRHAGDEFVALLPQCSAEQAGSVAERLLGAIALPASAGQMTLHPSASIGVAMYPDDGHDIELLVRHADMAMHGAKAEGGGRFRFFSGDMHRVAQERVALETALSDALRLDHLSLQYQPQVSVTKGADSVGQIYGVEALARWHHAELGEISPQRFVEVAEGSGLIDQLSLWVLRESCAQMADWRRRGINVPRVSVNISAINFRDPGFSVLLSDTLAKYGLKPSDLALEMTESVMLDPNPDVLANIEAIYSLGVCLSLDDFGTGYSSLSHLHRLPINELKLDKSFVHDIDTSAIARTLTTSVLRIGESLSMTVVAEGVETESQQRFLSEQGCPILQGYLLSRPLSSGALEQWLLDESYDPIRKINTSLEA